jgi:hypothetical protein
MSDCVYEGWGGGGREINEAKRGATSKKSFEKHCIRGLNVVL